MKSNPGQFRNPDKVRVADKPSRIVESAAKTLSQAIIAATHGSYLWHEIRSL
jgi:hypothetical protein